MEIQTWVGEAIDPFIPDLARLRIEVFRDFPYLYEGTAEYEEHYLRKYVECPRSVLVIAVEGERVIGCSTGLPLDSAADEFRQPFVEAGLPTRDVFYCAESVLRPEFRGHGIGHRFFEEREAHARELGDFSISCFCAVERPDGHPLRPGGYRSHDRFWTGRGYRRRPELQTRLAWQDVDEAFETEKSMVFWTKVLAPVR